MQFSSLSKLNTAFGSPLRRVVFERVNSIAHLLFEDRILSWRSSLLTSVAAAAYCTFRINKYLENPIASSLCYSVQRKPMTASGSPSASGGVFKDNLVTGCSNVLGVVKPVGVFLGVRDRHSCQKAVISLRNQDVPLTHIASSKIFQRTRDSHLFARQCLRDLHTSASASYSSDAAADVPFDIASRDEKPENSTDSQACKNVSQKNLKLISGSCYLPHPDKVETGGEDAHFICEEKGVIGVADGVGGWADVGVDAGEYARCLMSNSVSAIKEDPEGLLDPAKVLEKAHSSTKVMGSSTACIIALTDQGIRAINLGDSGFIVIRDGSTVFRSPVQQYGFNFPYQLASGTGGDLPSSGQVLTFPVAPGDVIVAGTDGLFDNLYNNEIAALVVQALRSHRDPQVTAQNIAALAQQRALDRNRKTPFAAAAHDAGYRYTGGKLDDITVVVAFVTGEDNQ